MYPPVQKLIDRQNSMNSYTRQNINKKLFDLHESKKLVSKRSAEEIEEISTSVKEMVTQITSEFKTYGDNEFYDVKCIHSVGSMAEGTRIGNPKEFDFIVELKKFSTTNMAKALEIIPIDTIEECATPFGVHHPFQHAHIKVIDTKMKETFKDYILKDEYLNKTLFSPTTRQAVLEYAIGNLGKNILSKNYGTLEITDIPPGKNGPAGSFVLLWKSKDEKLFITIDTVMAIAVSQEMLKDKESIVNDCFKHLKNESCFLLPAGSFQNNRCFKYAFTLTEVERMKSLSDYHKICYRLMKDFVGRDGSVSRAFPSYVLKTVVLRHSEKCEEKNDVFSCIVDIITEMSKTCSHGDFVHLAEHTLFLKQNFVSEAPCDREIYPGLLDDLITLQILEELFPNK